MRGSAQSTVIRTFGFPSHNSGSPSVTHREVERQTETVGENGLSHSLAVAVVSSAAMRLASWPADF